MQHKDLSYVYCETINSKFSEYPLSHIDTKSNKGKKISCDENSYSLLSSQHELTAELTTVIMLYVTFLELLDESERRVKKLA